MCILFAYMRACLCDDDDFGCVCVAFILKLASQNWLAVYIITVSVDVSAAAAISLYPSNTYMNVMYNFFVVVLVLYYCYYICVARAHLQW